MPVPTLTRLAASGPPVLPLLPRPVTALVTNRPEDIGCTPVVHLVPADGGGQPRLRAAGGVPALAARHHSPLVVASGRGPTGLDAHSLIEASAAHGGPFGHAVAPTRFTAPVNGAGLGTCDLSPAGLRNVWTLAQRGLPTPAARQVAEGARDMCRCVCVALPTCPQHRAPARSPA
ncbi:hypothetical protein [Streptomyces sp. NPDC003635]